MVYTISYETLNTCITFMALIFGAVIACEFLKTDIKYLYQGVALLCNAAVGLVCGWALFTENVIVSADTFTQYPALGFVLATFGAFNFILLLAVWLPKVLSPYGRAGSDFMQQPKAPMRPQKPGGF